ncbi:MAG: alpha/beta hydrolase [Clostridia bacterium]|nr:alpha/beta hydrolase [Clostridia bacterium]
MKKLEDIVYGEYGEANLLDVYLPEDKVEGVFVYFHGGGLDHGSKRGAYKFAPYLSERNIAVVSANYRMYPDYAFPDFLYDAANVVRWTYDYMTKEHNCDTIYVGGSSAGGYISMMLCFDQQYLGSVGLSNKNIAGYLHDAGQPTAHFTVLKNKGIDHRRIIVDETAPLFYIGLEEKYPPMRFIVSDNDMKNRYEQTMLVLSTLKHFGYENYDHIVMHGKHTEYVGKFDENDISVFGQMIDDFIKKTKE